MKKVGWYLLGIGLLLVAASFVVISLFVRKENNEKIDQLSKARDAKALLTKLRKEAKAKGLDIEGKTAKQLAAELDELEDSETDETEENKSTQE